MNDVGTSPLFALSAAVTSEGPTDTDADGVPGLIDNCVSIPNADQEPSVCTQTHGFLLFNSSSEQANRSRA